ncbi:MAG: tRNA (adenosine(37)-N6)-threonylcarbamoyltransferase complex dimerization subunit type 1 TsaB [Erysipelothrix sp.]|nr:tRNA (adenosine(37)-N6)-threonylcarbamoyltransferase complex dimerization subunit type 1 TsaB [Erysipelothrix sp.]
MLYLGIDTSNKYLIVTLFNDDEVLYFKQIEAKRQVSEICNVEIKKGFDHINKTVSHLSGIVVTRGPGSFTGVRIALSIAKVMAMTLDIPLYSVSSMQYYSGISSQSVLLDARSKKAFLGHYDKGSIVSEEQVLTADLNTDLNYIGDLELLDKDYTYGDLSEHFRLLKPYWKSESVFDAKPDYLKNNL